MPKLDAALIKRNAAAIAQANPLYELVNKNWEKVEDFFRNQGVLAPVTAWLETSEGGLESGLGISKSGGQWRVHVVTSHINDPEQVEHWALICDAPIATRVAMLQHVPKLFDKLVESNEKAVADLADAAKKSSEAFQALGIF